MSAILDLVSRLREQADHARRLSWDYPGDPAQAALARYADELDAKADELNAKART